MPNGKYTIRIMNRSEVDLAIAWAATEGWNPGLRDAECFYAADPQGFLVGLIGGQPIASISAVKYGSKFGFLGSFLVAREHRGRGYGVPLWEAGLAHLEGRTIGLNAAPAQQTNYARSGFVVADTFIRYEGVGGGKPPEEAGIVPLSAIPFDELLAYDEPFLPGGRPRFLRCWIDQPGSTALGVRLNGGLAGYGVVRAACSGWKVGPLFADTPGLAESLFGTLKAHVPEGSSLFVDPPTANPAALELVKRHGMVVVAQAVRMYKGGRPDLPMNRLFGGTTLELG